MGLLGGYQTNFVDNTLIFERTFLTAKNHEIKRHYPPPNLTTCVYLWQIATKLLAESQIYKGCGPLVESLRRNGELITMTEEQKKLVDEGHSNPQVVRSVSRLVACTLLQIVKNLLAQIDHWKKIEVYESFIQVMTQLAIGQELESSEMMFADECKAMLTAPLFNKSQLDEMLEKLKWTAIRMSYERMRQI